MNSKTILLYATPITILLSTAQTCLASDAGSSNSSKVDVEQVRAKYYRNEQNDLDKAMTDANTLAENIDQQADKDVSSVPKILYDKPGLTAKNADYDAMVNQIRLRERAQLKETYNKLLEQESMIREAYERKISDLEQPQDNGLKGTALKLASVKHTL